MEESRLKRWLGCVAWRLEALRSRELLEVATRPETCLSLRVG